MSLLHIYFYISPPKIFTVTIAVRGCNWILFFLLFSLPPSFPSRLLFCLFSPFSFFLMSTRPLPIQLLEPYSSVSVVKPLSPHFLLCDITPVKMKCYSRQCLILFAPVTVNTSIIIKTFRSTLSVLKDLLTYQGKLW